MYVVIDSVAYTVLRNLTFAPQTDMTGNSVPINEISVDIVTDDNVSFGRYVELYDDLDNLWCKYWITYAERTGEETVRIRGGSDISILDKVTLPATMYENDSVSSVLDETIVSNYVSGGLVATLDYTLDSSYSNATITGFCPEQTARQRLQWICFVLGAYVKTFYTDEITILPIDSTLTLVPIDKIYWKPTVTYKDYVTAIAITGYVFTQGIPAFTDDYVTDGTTTWIVTKQTYSLANPSAPAGAPDNVITIDGVYLVNSTNVSGILSHLSQYYFKRTEVELSVIDNAEYIPGDKLTVYADEDLLFDGFVESCEFAFGVQAKASVRLTAAENRAGAKLTIKYMYGSTQLDMRVYTLPVGYSYTITNPFIDIYMNGHRYVFRPTTAAVVGTLTSAGATVTVNYAVALDLYQGVLHVISVDSITEDTSGDYDVGVIA